MFDKRDRKILALPLGGVGEEGSLDSVDTAQIFVNPGGAQRITTETPFSQLDILQSRDCSPRLLLPDTLSYIFFHILR